MQLPEIVIDKKTKKSEKEVDIKAMITLVAFSEEEYANKRRSTLQVHLLEGQEAGNDNLADSAAEVYENGIKLYLQVDTGSAANLKPELVMEAFSEYLGIPYNRFAWQVHRLEVYTRDGETGKLAALDQVER